MAGQQAMASNSKGRFRLDTRKKIIAETDGTLQQRSCGCPISGSVQGQVGWGPGLEEGVPANSRRVGTR